MKTRGKLTLPFVCFLTVFAVGASAATNTINVVNSDFVSPQTGLHTNPTINVGDTVQWVWASGPTIPHTVTSAPGQPESWDSSSHTQPFSFTHTFNELGTYNYYCTIHGFTNGCGNGLGMSGQIFVVLPGAAPIRVTTVAREGNNVRINWLTGGLCKTNVLQRASGGADGSYTNNYVDIFTVTGTTGTGTNYLDVGAATDFPARYYRVRMP